MNWDKNIIRAELEKIAINGRLTPESVVETSKDENHPLHSYFEWDDEKAAHQHRLDKARKIIVFIPIVRKTQSKRIVPQWVRDPTVGREQGYISIDKIRQDPSSKKKLVQYEISRALATLERAKEIAVELNETGMLNIAISRALTILEGAREMIVVELNETDTAVESLEESRKKVG